MPIVEDELVIDDGFMARAVKQPLGELPGRHVVELGAVPKGATRSAVPDQP